MDAYEWIDPVFRDKFRASASAGYHEELALAARDREILRLAERVRELAQENRWMVAEAAKALKQIGCPADEKPVLLLADRAVIVTRECERRYKQIQEQAARVDDLAAELAQEKATSAHWKQAADSWRRVAERLEGEKMGLERQ